MTEQASNHAANLIAAEAVSDGWLTQRELPGGQRVTLAPIQSISSYVQEIRASHGLYRLWADDPDQAAGVIDTLEGNPTVFACTRYLGLAACGNRWSVTAERPEHNAVAQIVEGAIKHIRGQGTDFLHGRKVLAKAVVRGLAMAHVAWREVTCRLGDDPYPRQWIVPTALMEVDKRKLRLYRLPDRRDLAYWAIFDPGVDGYVVLEDRSIRPDVPPGFAAQDFLWYYSDLTERSAGFGESVGDQLYEIVSILQRCVGYRAMLAERWSEPTFVYGVDMGMGVITEATMGEAFKSPYERSDAFQATLAKWVARHSIAKPKHDELEIVEHGAGTAASHEEFLRYLKQEIKTTLLLGDLVDSGKQGASIGNTGDAEERAEAIELNIQYHRQRLEECCTDGLVWEFVRRNAATLIQAGYPVPYRGDLAMQFTSHKAQDPEMLKARLEIAEKWMPDGVSKAWLHDELDIPAAQPGEEVAMPKPEPEPAAGAGAGAPPPFQFSRGHVPRAVTQFAGVVDEPEFTLAGEA